ncbi:probable RNA-binding protein EIF1AD [Episyrphus balteatus]|uniref:probable RNA-binding protein EIF1AD n=1 Tax=Episyrphus balteatus TaxID=286459 RepID=UPI0024854260|nr:probable RNA-binding protein EIF1AD [Episyrphus balteatus]
MSRVTRNKHVMKEMMDDDFELPKDNQQIVRVTSSRGNNLHEVENAEDAEKFLVSMPTKFRKNVWVKRGDFVLVEPIEEGDKVKAEICKVLTSEHVKEYTKAGIWPKKFTKKREHSEEQPDEEDGDRFMVRNLNRPQESESESEDETDSSDED